MADNTKSTMFREVQVPTLNSFRWKKITINTGASASTLQDIKVQESHGGYSFIDSGVDGSPVRNRFIYWRTYQDVLELVEESLDLSLSGGAVRYRFQDTPVLPRVSIQEFQGNVIILVATVASVHRLVFPHPTKLSRPGFVLSEYNTQSIFYDATLPDDSQNQFLLTPGGNIATHLTSSASIVCADGHALFSLATTTGSILLIKMPPLGVSGVVIQNELSCSSRMMKLLNGIIPGAIRGSSQVVETAVDVELLQLHDDILVVAVCKDLRLRVWSYLSKDSVLNANLLDFIGEEFNFGSTSSSGIAMKRVSGLGLTYLCVYIALKSQAKFLFLNLDSSSGKLQLKHITTIGKTPLEDLVDFAVTREYLMTLWNSQNGETVAYAYNLSDCDVLCSPVHLLSCQDVVIEPHRDPREVYLEKIFYPGQFAAQDIVKALNFYPKTPASVELEALHDMDLLRLQVINAVDTEIRNCAADYEVEEEAYVNLQLTQWKKFYSCCVQYKQVGEKAKGLFSDPVTGLFCIIKKKTFSFLRPCGLLEELYLSPVNQITESTLERLGLVDSECDLNSTLSDVRLFCACLRAMQPYVSPTTAANFDSNLHLIENSKQLVETLQETFSYDKDLLGSVANCLCRISNLVNILDSILNLFEFNVEAEMDTGFGPEHAGHQHYSKLFAGNLGLSVLTHSFQQTVTLGLHFVRDIIFFIHIYSELEQESGMLSDLHEAISKELLPKGIRLLQCYKVLVWASEALSSVNANNAFDFNLTSLAGMDIAKQIAPSSKPVQQSCNISQIFLEGIGGEESRRRLSQQNITDGAIWTNDLQRFINTLCVLVWPGTDDTLFPEFLMRSCQYLSLQEYTEQLKIWCTWNESSRAFFSAMAYLHFGEPYKAVKLFVKASDGVSSENFLYHKLLGGEEEDLRKLQVQYYLKVIKQLEEHDLPDLVITMAMEAINIADTDDPNLPTLMSKVFYQHLELGHNHEAFCAMMKNPDIDRRKDCLRQLLVVLCERGNLKDLVKSDYQALEDEVVYVLEKRARSVDISSHDYYSLLYSFFIHRKDYRKASRVMYERGLRLAQEVPGLKSLQQQAQCLLSTLATLRLVHTDYAWIVKPSISSTDSASSRPLKHDADGHNKPTRKRRLEILELPALEREYLLLDARLRLIRAQPESSLTSGPMPTPEEVLSLLCSAGFYDVAVSISKSFKISPEPILTSLSLRCVTLSMSSVKISGNEANSEAWLWLRENNVPPCGAKELTVSDRAWTLLQSYIKTLEDSTMACHKCVAYTLLSQCFQLPTWLVNSYKEKDVAGLLRVYLTFDLLQPAAMLAMEYLHSLTDVLVGIEAPAFGVEAVRKAKSLCVWVPYTCLDQLMAALRGQETPHFNKMYDELQEKLNAYQIRTMEMTQQITAC